MRWSDAVATLGGTSGAWPRLEARYAEPHRRHHTLTHAAAVARDSAWLAGGLGDTERAIVAVAAWTHDVVYDAKPGEDERASAAWAREALAGVAEAHVERVQGLILATIGHDAPADDLLATALLDADLAVLGAPEAQYAAYARGARSTPSTPTTSGAKGVSPSWSACSRESSTAAKPRGHAGRAPPNGTSPPS